MEATLIEVTNISRVNNSVLFQIILKVGKTWVFFKPW